MSALLELLKDELREAREQYEMAANKVRACVEKVKAQQILEFEANPTLEAALCAFNDNIENVAGYEWLKKYFLTKWPRLGITVDGSYHTQIMQYLVQISVWHDASDDELERLAMAIIETALVITAQPERDKRMPAYLNKFAGFRLFSVMSEDLSASGILNIGIDIENKKAVLFRTSWSRVERLIEKPIHELEVLLAEMRAKHNYDGSLRNAWVWHEPKVKGKK